MTTWRKYSLPPAADLVTEGVGTLPVHPAADLLPDMSATELERLTADMKANGYNGQPIVIGTSSGSPPFWSSFSFGRSSPTKGRAGCWA